MTKSRRRHYSGTEKVAILKRHLVNGEPISDICDDLKINPTQFYRWQKVFFENGATAFENRPSRAASRDRKIQALEETLAEKNDVISELVTERIKQKKTIGVH